MTRRCLSAAEVKAVRDYLLVEAFDLMAAAKLQN
jgi:hypothetical protein